MSVPSPTSDEQTESGTKAGKVSNRSRSACDACRRSKIKCSGESPCSTCRWSQTRCHFTPGRRLGRPKGSKNKRTLSQQSTIGSIDEERQDDPVLWVTDPQVPLNPSTFDLDLDHGPDSITRFMTMNGFLDANDSLTHDTSDFIDSALSLIDPMLLNVDPSSFCHIDSMQHDGSDKLFNFDNVLDLYNDHGARCSPTMGSNSPIIPSTPTCSCLSQLAQSLYQLEGLRSSDGSSSADVSVDFLLRGFQTVEQPWKGFMCCSAYKTHEDHKAALLLFAMSIRNVLNKTICPNTQPCKEPLNEIPVSIGSLNLTGEARSEILSLAVGRAMRNFIAALQHVKGCIARLTGASTSDMDRTSLQLHSLAEAIDAVDSKNNREQKSGLSGTHTYARPEKDTILLLLEVLEQTIKVLE